MRILRTGQLVAITSKRYHNGYWRQSAVPAEAIVTSFSGLGSDTMAGGDGSYEASIGGLDSGSSLSFCDHGIDSAMRAGVHESPCVGSLTGGRRVVYVRRLFELSTGRCPAGATCRAKARRE